MFSNERDEIEHLHGGTGGMWENGDARLDSPPPKLVFSRLIYLVGNNIPRLFRPLRLLLDLRSSFLTKHSIPGNCNQIFKTHHHHLNSVGHCNNTTSGVFGNFRHDRMLIIIVCTPKNQAF